MKRRDILGLAATTLGASLTMGSGAFNTVRADREITVDIVNDVEAYLRIDPLGTTNKNDETLGRSDQPGMVTTIQFPGTYEEINDLVEGDGAGPDSEYYFDNLVEVGNQGTNRIKVFSASSGDITQVAIYDSSDEDRTLLTDEDSGVELGTGDIFEAGIYINTHGMDTGEYEGTLTFAANAIDSS